MESESIKAVIVDDEPSASQNLSNILRKQLENIDVVDIASNVSEGITAIDLHKPDLLFLDIQLGDQTSFELLEKVNFKNFQIIFVTAFSEYAVRAFQFSAVDYILKPINPERLRDAVEKVKVKLNSQLSSKMLEVLVSNLANRFHRPNKIVLSTADMVHVIDINDIIKCQSSANYTIFYLIDGKELIISKTLKAFDDQLSGSGFFRVHRSWLINEDYITGYDKREGGFVVLKDQSKLPISPKKKDELLRLIKKRI